MLCYKFDYSIALWLLYSVLFFIIQSVEHSNRSYIGLEQGISIFALSPFNLAYYSKMIQTLGRNERHLNLKLCWGGVFPRDFGHRGDDLGWRQGGRNACMKMKEAQWGFGGGATGPSQNLWGRTRSTWGIPYLPCRKNPGGARMTRDRGLNFLETQIMPPAPQ